MVSSSIAAWAALFLLAVWMFQPWRAMRAHAARRGTGSRESYAHAPTRPHSRRKPDWAVREVIDLKAICPAVSARDIAGLFNQRHVPHMTVQKTWVADRLREHAAAVLERRRELRRRTPWRVAVNAVWALDITTLHGNRGPVFAILDHGSRRLLRLAALPRKCTFTLLGHLCLTIADFGLPRAIRSDNESMFTSRLWQRAMRWLRVRHQRSAPGRPWQNGRVERLFGTVKPWLRALLPAPTLWVETQRVLDLARVAYNEYRPHQALGGLTPMQVWCGMTWDDVARENGLRRSRAGGVIGERWRW
jgi:putative transposase